MVPFPPTELHGAHHAAKVAALRTSMQRPPLRPARAAGIVLITIGAWLAREEAVPPAPPSVGAHASWAAAAAAQTRDAR